MRLLAAIAAGLLLALSLGACFVPELEKRVCSSAADCVDGFSCSVGLCSQDCHGVLGDVDADDPLLLDPAAVEIFGVLLPLTVGGVADEAGRTREAAVRVAVDEINLSGGIDGRTLAGISCDSGTDTAKAQRAADHLVRIGVSAVVGEAASPRTLAVFTETLLPAGVLMMAPSSTSIDLTTQPDDQLLFRTTVSDEKQGPLLGELVIDETTAADTVVVIAADDSYGAPLADAVTAGVCAGLVCSRLLVTHRFDDIVDVGVARAALRTIDEDLGDRPPAERDSPLVLVVLIGQKAQLAPWLAALDSLDDDDDDRYAGVALAFTDTMRERSLLDLVAADHRVTGTAPVQETAQVEQQILRDSLPDDVDVDQPFAAHAYDAAAVVGLLHAATGEQRPGGAALSAAIARLVDGEAVALIGQTAGQRNIVRALGSLGEDNDIDIDGISGPLDFDVNGDVDGDIEVWIVCDEAIETADLTTARPSCP
ncbi:MAG: ABC transporter substrate-binding protein [Deltaproteobacteria bacterium]|nr:ABC transporter substrate-binding protein [Deltaproteobacteria bacterium]